MQQREKTHCLKPLCETWREGNITSVCRLLRSSLGPALHSSHPAPLNGEILGFSPASSNNKHQIQQISQIPKGSRWEIGFLNVTFQGGWYSAQVTYWATKPKGSKISYCLSKTLAINNRGVLDYRPCCTKQIQIPWTNPIHLHLAPVSALTSKGADEQILPLN